MSISTEHKHGLNREHGLVVLRASRLEALLDPLEMMLDALPPAHPLAAQELLAAHAGMRHWLMAALAQRRGSTDIVANLQIDLPWEWVDRMSRRLLRGDEAQTRAWQRPQLRWQVHELLRDYQAIDGLADPRLASYLQQAAEAGADELARRRFQIAERLAGIYSQYLVYRIDWLEAWEQGRDQVPAGRSTPEQLLAPLWRCLVRQLGEHRGHRLKRLLRLLDKPADLFSPREDSPLHVFGIAHLAPSELDLLRAVARKRLVVLYVPDPCREYWGGLASRMDQLRERLAAERQHLRDHNELPALGDSGHPLLASWGRMGQHFMMRLVDSSEEVIEDTRHWQDSESPLPGSLNRLQRLQQSIRELDPALMSRPLDEATLPHELQDASLRVHVCHTRLRELEVLHDQLLDALDADPALRPADIVVMAPDIQAYLPLIASVFGAPGYQDGPLPYHLADVSVASSHRLFSAFEQLLKLPATRVTAAEVMDLLGVPEIMQRLNLDADSLQQVHEWLASTRVAWALDARHRASFEVPALAGQSFAWGMERMIAGYLLADAACDDLQQPVTLPDGMRVHPLSGIGAPAAECLGALDALLRQIQRLLDASKRSLPASAWVQLLDDVLEALFRIDVMDRDAQQAMEQLQKFIAALGEETAAASALQAEQALDPELRFVVVREVLLERMRSVSERQHFLLGGVTICGMVPQRAVPFSVVAVLGLNDGEFPRKHSDGGLDLMARFPRVGDRDVRSDDRYLFLETLMSARRRLHLSYVGEDVHDGKPRNPALPLAELMAELERHSPLTAPLAGAWPWIVQHPMQAFDTRYFDADAGDARLFSYSERSRLMAEAPMATHEQPLERGRFQPHLPAPQAPATLSLAALHQYFRDPALYLLRQQLRLSLDAVNEDELQSSEMLDANFLPRDTVARRIYLDRYLPALADSGDEATPQLPAAAMLEELRLRGMAPLGPLAELAWQQECERLGALSEAQRALQAIPDGWPGWYPLQLELSIDGWRLQGSPGHLVLLQGSEQQPERLALLRAFPAAQPKTMLKKGESLHLGERISVFLDWALSQLSVPAGCVVDAAMLIDGRKNDAGQLAMRHWSAGYAAAEPAVRELMAAELRDRLALLLRFLSQAGTGTLWYFPRSASQALGQLDQQQRQRQREHGDVLTDKALAWSVHNKVKEKWAGAPQREVPGERDYGAGHARLLAGKLDFDLQRQPEQLDALLWNACWLDYAVTVPDAPGGADT